MNDDFFDKDTDFVNIYSDYRKCASCYNYLLVETNYSDYEKYKNDKYVEIIHSKTCQNCIFNKKLKE